MVMRARSFVHLVGGATVLWCLVRADRIPRYRSSTKTH